MNPESSVTPRMFTNGDRELLTCLIAAPDQAAAAEWLQITPTHLRRRLKALRDKMGVETNLQLVTLAAFCGVVDVTKTLP